MSSKVLHDLARRRLEPLAAQRLHLVPVAGHLAHPALAAVTECDVAAVENRPFLDARVHGQELG